MSLTVKQREQIEDAVRAFLDLEAQADASLSELSEKAEDTGDYRYYDEARYDWKESLADAGSSLAREIAAVLGTEEVPLK